MCFSDTPTIHKRGKKPRKLDFVGRELPKDLPRGWRAWKVKRDGDKVTLLSPIQPATWESGKPMTGKVDPKQNSGIYCFKSLSKLKSYTNVDTTKKDVIVGEVVLWGEVAEHRDGFRGANGYPAKIWTNDISLQSLIRDRYGCSVQVGRAADLKAA